MKTYLLIALILLATACTPCNKEQKQETAPISDHALTMATLYTYYADEYKALCYQAYNIAGDRIDDIRKNNPDNKNLAIVVDIDETVLDNSPNEAMLIAKDTNYPYMWNEWCELANAKAVPGALEFLQYADEQGFNIFYVSNRKAKYTSEGTMKNLINLGFPQVKEDHFMLRLGRSELNPNPSDKQPRRDEITVNGYEIVLLVGDNLGDFYTDEKNYDARLAQMESFRKEFGYKFIVLPNAMYGNWVQSLGINDPEKRDSLLLLMTKAFEK